MKIENVDNYAQTWRRPPLHVKERDLSPSPQTASSHATIILLALYQLLCRLRKKGKARINFLHKWYGCIIWLDTTAQHHSTWDTEWNIIMLILLLNQKVLFVQKISTPMSYLRSSAENVLRKWWEKKTRKYNLNIDQHFPFQYWSSLLQIAWVHILFLYFVKALVQEHKT